MNHDFYEELLSHSRKGELATFILNIIYDKKEEPGDESMIGVCSGKAFIKIHDSITEVLDDCGNILCTLNTEFYLVDDYDNEYYIMHKNSLYNLCNRLNFLLDANSVIFI